MPSIDIVHYPGYIVTAVKNLNNNAGNNCLIPNPNTALRGIINSAFVATANRNTISNPNNIVLPNDLLYCFTEPTSNNKPKAGLLVTNPIVGNPDLKYDGYGLTKDNNPLKPSKTNTNILDANDGTKLGNIGFTINNANIQKIKAAYGSVGSVLDKYLYVIKFLIIQKIIEITNKPDIQDNGNVIINQKLQDTVTEDKGKLKDTLEQKYLIKNQVNPLLFTTVAKLADGLVISLIQEFVNTGVSNYVNNFLQNNGVVPDYNVLYNKTIKQIDIALIRRLPTTGFETNLTNLFDDILDLYSGTTNTDFNSLMYTVNVMEDEEEISPQYKIYNSNYRLTSEIVEKKML